MTIKQLANRIIKDLKAWPEEARQSQDIGGPKTSWDEYKEQVQYEEYDSFEVFEETIESMVRDEVSDLSEKLIENLYRQIHTNDYNATGEEKREDIVNAVFSHIKSEAETQDIEYNDIDKEFIKYNVDDLTIVAEVLSKVGPDEFLINGYSEVTGPGGEQGIANLSESDNENKLEWITPEEFEREKKRFNVKWLSPAEADLENENQANKLLNNENKTDCLLTQNDQLHNPEPLLVNKVVIEKAQVAKAVKDLVLLTAKATKKTPLEVIREMKRNLDERKARREQQAQLIEQQGINPSIKRSKNENKIDMASQEVVPNNPNVGLDPETMQAGITLSGILIESGTTKFEDYVRAMIADIGPGIKPYLKSFYSAVRYQPGFNAEGMDSLAFIDKVDVEKMTIGT